MVNNKGKSIAVGRETYGKRRRNGGVGGSSGGGEDGDTSRQKKRKNPGVLQFFEDAANVDDDDDSSDDGGFDINDFMEEEFDTQPKVNNEPGKDHNFPFIPKEEEIDEEEFNKMMGERYKEGSTFVNYAEDDYETKRLIDRGYHIPTQMDPIIWKVKCMVGRERQSAFCLMQKFIDLQSLGTKLQIISAFAIEHIKGFIYIEADKQSDIIEACKGLSGIYSSRMAQVAQNEVSHLLSTRIKYNEVSAGMWAYVKNGKYKGDLAQVVDINNARKRATVKLIPRINLQALAAKFGGGVTLKKNATVAPRLISSSELDEFRPLIQYRHDRETGRSFEVLDGMMLKDGYLYKKISLDSLNCWGVVPSEEELLKFRPSDSNESADLEWLSQLYGEQKKKKNVTIGKGGDKGESSSGPSSANGFELYELACFGRKDFGLIIGMEKDDQYKILKEGPEGPSVVNIERRMLKTGPFDMKFTALDQQKQAISINDTVRVVEGPSKDRQGIVRQIYRGIIFLYDENETENGGYFCSKSQLCEKIKISADACVGKDGEPIASCFEEPTSSPKSPLSPKRPWQAKEFKSHFKQGDRDGMFTVGQTLRIRVGPLKGYLCRVLAIRYSDITVKLDSRQKVLTVKSEHLAEVRGRSFATSNSEDPGSGTFKPFDLLGTEGCSGDWMNGSGTSAEGDGWNAGGSSAERNSWPSFSAAGTLVHVESSSANPLGSNDCDPKHDGEDSAWECKATAEQNSSWGAAVAGGKSEDCWNKGAAKNMGSDSGSWGKSVVPIGDPASSLHNSEDNWGNTKLPADSPNASTSWGKNKDACDNQDKWNSDPWDKGKNAIGNSTSSWGDATAEKNQLDSWGKRKDTVDSGWNKPKSLGKLNWSNKDGSGGSKLDWNKPAPVAEDEMGSWGNKGGDWTQQGENTGVSNWKKAQVESGSQVTNWTSAKNSNEDETAWGTGGSGNRDQKDGWKKPEASGAAEGSSWNKQDGGSSWTKQADQQHSKQAGGSPWDKQEEGSSLGKQQEGSSQGGSSWGKQDGGSSWGNKQDAGSSCGKHDSGSSWSKQADQQDGGSSWGKQESGSSWGKKGGGSSWSEQADQQEDAGSSWGNKQDAGSSWGKQVGGSSWSKQADQQDSWEKQQSFDGGRGSGGRRGRGGGRGGRDQFGRGRSFGQCESSGWRKEGPGNNSSSGGDDWKSKASDMDEKQLTGWGQSASWKGMNDSSGNQDSNWGKKGKWNSGSSDGDKNQGSGWGERTNWYSGSSGAGENLGTSWGNKGNLNSGSSDAASNQDSTWAKICGDVNQDSSWGKKSSWDSGSADANQHPNGEKRGSWNSGSGNANQGSSWDRKTSWNSPSGDANQHSNWGNKSNWNSESGSDNANQNSGWGKKGNWNMGSVDANQESSWGKKGDWNSRNDDQTDTSNNRTSENWRGFDGGDGSNSGSFRGRGDSDRSSRGRGRSDRGGFRGRGRSDGGFGGRGSSDRGGFGGRGYSNRGGFGGREGSNRREFGGRGQGRRDQGCGWNGNGSGDNNSFDNKPGGDKGQWKSWNAGNSGTNVAGRDQVNNWKSSDASAGGQWSSSKNSDAIKEIEGTSDQGNGWNKGAGASAQAGGWSNQSSGWNNGMSSGNGGRNADQPNQSNSSEGSQSTGWGKPKDTGEGGGGGWGSTDSWGKTGGSGKGGW